MDDYILVTVEINANGERRTFMRKYEPVTGKHVSIEAASAGADAGARAALLWLWNADDANEHV
jgi:hypothetical protein